LGLGYSHYIIFGFSAVAIIWGIIKATQVNGIVMDESKIKPDVDEKDAGEEMFNKRRAESFELMKITNAHVKQGAKSFLAKEYTMLAIFCALFATVLLCCVDMPWKKDNLYPAFPYTSFCFLVGASTSMLAGYLGMMIATSANVKVTYLCNFDID